MPDYLNVVYSEKIKPHTNYPQQLCQYLSKRFNMKQADNLLDVGCGRGDFTKGFKDLGMEVLGVDLEKGNSEMLKGIEVKLGDIENQPLPFRDEIFDFVFSKSVIEHFKTPDNFIKEIYRVLKPGGRIITMTPDWQSQRRIFYDDYTHAHPYTVNSLSSLLKIYGFKDVVSENFYQLPIIWKHSWIKIFAKFLQLFGPVKKIHKNKFIRWSRELMVLGTGIKPDRN